MEKLTRRRWSMVTTDERLGRDVLITNDYGRGTRHDSRAAACAISQPRRRPSADQHGFASDHYGRRRMNVRWWEWKSAHMGISQRRRRHAPDEHGRNTRSHDHAGVIRLITDTGRGGHLSDPFS